MHEPPFRDVSKYRARGETRNSRDDPSPKDKEANCHCNLDAQPQGHRGKEIP